ncbi:MAG: hypothetical protein K2F99_04530, partial [Muribaculaceae bacterium]|nr:hypothetical protein [Muribaculaceae bacterium]
MERKVYNVRDHMIGIDRLVPAESKVSHHYGKGVLYRDDGLNAFGRPIFTKVAENTVTLGGAIQSLEKLTGVEASFQPKTLNELMGINASGFDYHIEKTPIALFGCGIGGASLTFDDVYEPNCRQTNLAELVPMMVSESELTGVNAPKYMMRSTISTPGDTTLNAWYLKEFETTPTIRSLWKDG